jgi:hypothetical protein
VCGQKSRATNPCMASSAPPKIGASQQRVSACGRSIRFGRELSKGALSSIERAPLLQRDLNHPVKRIGSPTVLNVEEVVAQC